MTQTDELLQQSNELLKQILGEVKKVLREMEQMNEMTRKRLPYKWLTGEKDKEKEAD